MGARCLSARVHKCAREIRLAALRCHDDFDPTLDLHHSQTGLPALLNEFLEVCRTIQMLDACLRSGRLKYAGDAPVTLLYNRSCMPDIINHSFVRAWLQDNHRRKRAIRALL